MSKEIKLQGNCKKFWFWYLDSVSIQRILIKLIAQCISKKYVLQHICKLWQLLNVSNNQFLIALHKWIKCQLVYYDVFINTLCILYTLFIIIKMFAMLVLSVNNWYTGLVGANIRYGKNWERFFQWRVGTSLIERKGVNTIFPLCPGNNGPFNNVKKKNGIFYMLNVCPIYF